MNKSEPFGLPCCIHVWRKRVVKGISETGGGLNEHSFVPALKKKLVRKGADWL